MNYEKLIENDQIWPQLEIERSNDRGCLFKNTQNFYKKFVPPLNRWEWSNDLPANCQRYEIQFSN